MLSILLAKQYTFILFYSLSQRFVLVLNCMIFSLEFRVE